MSLIDRVKGILMSPNTEWDVIRDETSDVQSLFVGYVIPLTVVAQVCTAIGLIVFGISVPFLGDIPVSFGTALTQAIVGVVMSIVMVYVLGLIINALAENFGGQKDQMQALKVAAYASTPSWVATILTIIPSLSPVVMLGGLYALYLLYLGLPKLMNAPKERATMYTLVVIIAAIVVGLVIGLITARFSPVAGSFM